ncbi:ATPase [Micromonospora sp. NPDC049523]|uniref:ATPase n=1 Tax=Micromonospora sp. NPDC049523 TaxID=3155921 RepID=UPI003416247C
MEDLRAAGASAELAGPRSGGGQQDWSDVGHPADVGYRPEPVNPAGPGYGPDPGESRYSVLDNGYRQEPAQPGESRYAALESEYRRNAMETDYGRAEPGYGRAEPAAYGRPEPDYGRPDAPGYGRAEPGYGRPDAAGYVRPEPDYGRPEAAGYGRPDAPAYGRPEPEYGRPDAAGYGRAEPGYGRADPAAYGRPEPDHGRADAPAYGRPEPDHGRADPTAYGRVDPGYAPPRSGSVGAASVPTAVPLPNAGPTAGPPPIIAPPIITPVVPPVPDPVASAPVSAAARVAPVRGGAARGAAAPANGNSYGAPGRVEWREGAPDAEVDRAVSVLRRDLGTPRVLAFANPKGGVHKTTATVLAAATVGSVRGRGVLAWDDNELRGTLGLRAGSARHARTIRHLITDLAEVELRTGTDLTGRLDDYLRHASDGSYNVLAGEESPRFASRLDQQTVRRVLDLLRRTQDVICVDTGNNVESVNWQTVIQAADQLVVTTVPREDAAFAADWMLDLLHEVGMGELADNAVTLVSCPTPGRSPLQADLERHFATRTRAVVVVPYDPALESGSSIEYGNLQHDTRQAWLKAASVMIEPFAR